MSKANYIICVHKDLDGICCAAIILQHYPDAKVFFSPQGSVQNIFYRLRSYLRNYVQNNFFICDISLDNSSVKHIKKILNKYVKEFDLHVIWMDHHDWDKNDRISDNIEVLLEPTSKSAAKLVQQYFDSNLNSVYVKIAEGEFVRYKFYWTTVIQNVCKKLYYDENLGYVLRAFSQFEPNEKTDEYYIVPQELSEKTLDSIPVFETNKGYKFAILEMENIEHEIKWQKEAYRIMKHHRCDFICIIFENGRYSFRSRTNVDLKFLKEHGVVGHLKDNSFHINIPYIKWRDTDFHRPITREELIEVLKGSNVIYETNHQFASLNRQKVDYIPHLRQLPSMSEELFNKLYSREITDLKELLLCDNEELKKFGIPYKSSIPLKKEALEFIKKSGFDYKSGNNLKENVEGHLIFQSGCSSLDTILGGGFFSQKLYELYGLPNTGKTLMIHQLLCQAILSSQIQSLRIPVVYIDTENHFSPEIIRSIALRFNLDPNYVFRNIARLEVNSADQLIQVVEEKLIQFIEKFGVGFVLVDNIITPFFEDYDGIETIPERQGKLASVLQALTNLAEKYKTAVIITNKAVKDYENDGYRHAGGTVTGYVQVRIAIKYVEDEINVRRFDIEKDVDKSEITCILSISSQGFYNTNYVKHFLEALSGVQGNFAQIT